MEEKVKKGGVAYRGVQEPVFPNSKTTNCRVYVEEPDGEGGRVMSKLSARLDVMGRSPCGFSWGYSGAGPHQLALALLLNAFGVPESPRRRDNIPVGEDPELDEERYREDEERRAARKAGMLADDDPIFMDDETELLTNDQGTVEVGLVRQAQMLHGELVGDILCALPQHGRWIIWKEDLLAWAHAKKSDREAVATKILRSAVTESPPAAPTPGQLAAEKESERRMRELVEEITRATLQPPSSGPPVRRLASILDDLKQKR